MTQTLNSIAIVLLSVAFLMNASAHKELNGDHFNSYNIEEKMVRAFIAAGCVPGEVLLFDPQKTLSTCLK